MKVSQSTVLLATTAIVVSTVQAFTPMIQRQSRPTVSFTTRHMVASEQDIVAGSAMPVADPYERIGITKEELGIGIDATEFLQWIGR